MSSSLVCTSLLPDMPSPPSSSSNGENSVSLPTKKRTKVPKALKDPTAPKRPLSPYLMFAAEERAKVVAEMGNLGLGQVGKEMGRRWSVLDTQTKEKYEAAYMTDKARYEEEKKIYQPSQQFLEMKAEQVKKQKEHVGTETNMEKYFSYLLNSWRKVSEENPSLAGKEIQEIVWLQWTRGKGMIKANMNTKKIRKLRDPAAPKKPLTAFFLFQKKMRKGGLVITSKAMAEMWKNLDMEGMQQYKIEEEELKVKYHQEMKEFREMKVGEGGEERGQPEVEEAE